MKNLLLSSILFLSLILSACSTSLHGFQKTRVTDLSTNRSKLLFANDTTEKVYTTHITFLSQTFSGLMIVKPYHSGDLRIVFMTETGVKIFDMSIPLSASKKSEVYYCIDPLNKGAILRSIKNDLSVLFMRNISKSRITEYTRNADVILAYKNKGVKRSYYAVKSNHITTATQHGLLSKCSTGAYFYKNSSAPDSLALRHTHLKMAFELHFIPD
jgi:hypothetical protein